jgi:PAS domain S-box-containing protein
VRGEFTFAHDVTQLRSAELLLSDERLRLEGIVTSAMDAIVTVDSRQRITLFNPAAERMFGASASDMLGKSLETLIPPELRPGHGSHIENFGVTGVTSRAMGALGTVYGLRANGEQFPLEAAISQIEVGNEKFYTAILRDITRRKRAAEALRQLNEDLEHRVAERTTELEVAIRELEAFDYTISHDLRAPLNRIRGFSQALLEHCGKTLDPEGHDFLQRITASGDSMDQLVTDLLSLSTLARGEIHRTSVDLGLMASGILDNLQRLEPGRNVHAVVRQPVDANADPGLVRIVLENLLGNAWKFTARRPDARIEFGCEDGIETARFFVRDNGAGFDAQFADKLFEPFRRLHAQSDYKGTGIGLATVQRIARRHGGRAWAEGAIGQGATIYFTLGLGA